VQLNLLEKTELRIYGLDLHEVNLTAVAARVAKVLQLPAEQVLVVDVREDHICLDILAKTVDMRQLIGKQGNLLDELRGIDGLKVMKLSSRPRSVPIVATALCGRYRFEFRPPSPAARFASWSATAIPLTAYNARAWSARAAIFRRRLPC